MNTGFGKLADQSIPPDKVRDLLIGKSSCVFGIVQ